MQQAYNELQFNNFSGALVFLQEAQKLANSQSVATEQQCYVSYEIGICYYALQDYPKAIESLTQALKICEVTLGNKHQIYAASLTNIGVCYYFSSNYQKAVEYYIRALEIFKEVLGDRHPNYADGLNKIGVCYSDMGDYQKAIEYKIKALEIRKEVLGDKHPDYASSLSNIGVCYYFSGDFQKAIEYYNRALEIRKEVLGDKDPDYAESLNNLGACYSDMGDYQKAIEYHTQALEIRKEVLGDKHPDYAYCLNNLGICYAEMDDYQKSIEYFTQALEIFEEVLGDKHPDYASSLSNLGNYYYLTSDYQKAIECHTRAAEISKEVFGDMHPDYAENMNSLSKAYFKSNDYKNFGLYNRRFINITTDNILNNFSYMTASQRSSYWNKYSYSISDRQYYYTYHLREDSSLLQSTYDCALLSKGILLNAESELRDMILDGGDEKMLALYDKFTLEKRRLALLLEKPISERTMPADSLEAVCDRLEQQLLKGCKVLGDYTHNLAIKWTDVQAKLGDKDIAVEFIEVPIARDTTKYCALVLKNGYDAPRFVELFDLKDLQALYAKYARTSNRESRIYTDNQLFDLVWKPLSEELEGVRNIYFGPAGELYQIAIEYADNGNGPLSTQKNLYRLSSTRQLAVVRESNDVKTSSVYGGLNYGESIDALIEDSKRYPGRRSVTPDFHFDVDSLNVRDLLSRSLDIKELPGTLEEARSITELMEEAGMSVTPMIGNDGTEAAFKAKSGTEQNILHIGTHGFYWTETEADKVGKFLNRHELISEDTGNRRTEDKALSRSGLLFSGAKNAFKKGYQAKPGVEDGILTAREISMLNLDGTDLVTLSACQTGLGEISGEGVFGLQRGFKKAGVNAILMSLWKVDDEATSMLMREFYRNYLIRKMTLRQSLNEAQKAVREYEIEKDEVEDISSDNILIDRLNNNDGHDTTATVKKKIKVKKFNDPVYWAGFVLLDGLDN